MNGRCLTVEALEAVYEVIADATDAVGEEHEGLFLAKLALVLANQLGDLKRVNHAIAIAREGLTGRMVTVASQAPD